MSGLFRSEDMTYVRVIMNDDCAYDTLSAENMASSSASGAAPVAASADSSYTHYKKRVAICQYWERKLQSFRDAFDQYRIPVPDVLDEGSVAIDEIRSADVVEDCRAFLEPVEASLAKNVVFRKQHKQQMNEFLEYMHVLKFNEDNKFNSAHSVEDFQQRAGGAFAEEKQGDVESGAYQAVGSREQFTNTICGVLPSDKIIAFERLLFRVSRGNAFSHFYEILQAIEDPQTGDRVKKSVFAVTFMGSQLARRIGRIVSHNNGSEYPIPATPNEIMALERDIQFKLNDAVMVLQRTDAEIKELLGSLAVDPATAARGTVSSPYLNWLTALQRERHICDILKKCDQEGPHSKMITLEGWCPSDSLEELKQTLHNAVRATQAKQAALQIFDHPPGHAAPPTYFKTNKFTESYQGIVDTYGVPRYKEVNPGLFTIISFPFLFGVMYGDIGHGTLLFLFALYLLWNEEKMLAQSKRGQLSEIPSMIFGGRYLLLLMGAFALYAGTIYNDLFSCPVNTFGSAWDLPALDDKNRSASLEDFSGVPYPYGVDPSWYHTSNELAFFNSMKMKLAVTLGVTQMVFGICLGALNDVYFKDYLAIAFEFVPRLIFILCTFGYMVFIIIFKMCTSWGEGTSPPLLIQTMIQMFLSPGSVKEEDELYAGQGGIQAALLLAAVFSVPLMLFPIPCITNSRNKAYLARHGLVPSGGGASASSPRSVAMDGQQRGQETEMHVMKSSGASSSSSSSSHAYAPLDLGRARSVIHTDIGFGEISHGGVSPLHDKLLNGDSNDDHVMRYPTSASAVVIDDRGDMKSAGPSVVSSADVQSPIISDEDDAGHGEHALGVDYNFADHMIVQGIHTIEFVLGTVSNTASYLRLWALSLAHAQLSAVFWDKMIMQYGLEGDGAYWPVIGFAVWAMATFAVLLCMDSLECFLHALRLHWVEFQNKFFRADGYAFEPFDFDKLDSDAAAL